MKMHRFCSMWFMGDRRTDGELLIGVVARQERKPVSYIADLRFYRERLQQPLSRSAIMVRPLSGGGGEVP
jgi:hypothetical protein